MQSKALLVIFVLVSMLLIAACGGRNQPSAGSTPNPDVYNFLRKPGKVTHVRYTTYTPPWPTRTEAWIDWDNNQARSWNIQWTDNPTNPGVCTSIRNGDVWYPCLPDLWKLGPQDAALAIALWPIVPLRASASELSLSVSGLSLPLPSLPVPNGATPTGGANGSGSSAVQLGKQETTAHDTQGATNFVVNSWNISSNLGEGAACQQGQTGAPKFEYTTTADGTPISEFITVTCGGQQQRYFGVLYHDVEFVDRSDLPQDFFDVDAARKSLIADEMSSAAAQLGSAYWLGDQVGNWTLTGAENDAASATVSYSRGDQANPETVQLTTRVSTGPAYRCDNAEPIPSDAHRGALCPLFRAGDQYRIVWTPLGFDVWLQDQSYPSIGRADILALATGLQQWTEKAPGPLLKEADATNLVADSLELVCPTNLSQIRAARSSASFTFDRKTGEWTGVFGSFGEYAVPDWKPVAIPTNHRAEVDSTLSHNAAQFADCTLNEQPTPQPGDDQFGITFVGKDNSGFGFQVTGVDSQDEAALSMCMAAVSGGCGLTDPGGVAIRGGAVTIDTVRTNVDSVHVGLKADELTRTGTWIFALDLGNGRAADVTFDVR